MVKMDGESYEAGFNNDISKEHFIILRYNSFNSKERIRMSHLLGWERRSKTQLNCSSKIEHISNLSDVNKFIYLS